MADDQELPSIDEIIAARQTMPGSEGKIDWTLDDKPDEATARARVTDFLRTSSLAGRPWQQTSEKLREHFPSLDPEAFKADYPRFEHERKLGEAKKTSMGMLEALKFQAGEQASFGSLLKDRQAGQYTEAKKRFEAGQPKDEDYQTIANYERAEQVKEEISNDPIWGPLAAMGKIPGMYGEFALGGKIVGAGAKVLGFGAPAATRLGAAGRFMGSTAAMTALAPSTYLEHMVAENMKAGRAPNDLTAFPAAFGLGIVQMGVLRGVSAAGSALSGADRATALAGIAGAAGSGVVGSAIADVITSSAGLDTGYGTIGQFLGIGQEAKPKTALYHAAIQALTFAAFAGLHVRGKAAEAPSDIPPEQATVPAPPAPEPMGEAPTVARTAMPPGAAPRPQGPPPDPVAAAWGGWVGEMLGAGYSEAQVRDMTGRAYDLAKPFLHKDIDPQKGAVLLRQSLNAAARGMEPEGPPRRPQLTGPGAPQLEGPPERPTGPPQPQAPPPAWEGARTERVGPLGLPEAPPGTPPAVAGTIIGPGGPESQLPRTPAAPRIINPVAPNAALQGLRTGAVEVPLEPPRAPKPALGTTRAAASPADLLKGLPPELAARYAEAEKHPELPENQKVLEEVANHVLGERSARTEAVARREGILPERYDSTITDALASGHISAEEADAIRKYHEAGSAREAAQRAGNVSHETIRQRAIEGIKKLKALDPEGIWQGIDTPEGLRKRLAGEMGEVHPASPMARLGKGVKMSLLREAARRAKNHDAEVESERDEAERLGVEAGLDPDTIRRRTGEAVRRGEEESGVPQQTPQAGGKTAAPRPEAEPAAGAGAGAAEDVVEGQTFKTSAGSEYTVAGAGTRRVKTPHLGHDPADVGPKKTSEATYYVSPEDARRIGMWNTMVASGKRLIVQGDHIILTSINPKTGQRGRDGAPIPISSRAPQKGLSPVELWEPSTSVAGGWRANHPGNEIVSLGPPPGAPAAENVVGPPRTAAPAAATGNVAKKIMDYMNDVEPGERVSVQSFVEAHGKEATGEALRQLRREGAVRLVSAGDRSKFTAEELSAMEGAGGESFVWVEREPPVAEDVVAKAIDRLSKLRHVNDHGEPVEGVPVWKIAEATGLRGEELYHALDQLRKVGSLRMVWVGRGEDFSPAHQTITPKGDALVEIRDWSPKNALKPFVDAVWKAAAGVGEEGRFHQNKIFIRDLWQKARGKPGVGDLTLEQFKQQLIAANSQNLLHLSRADHVPAMDPKQVEESQASYLNATFHFLLDEPVKPPRTVPEAIEAHRNATNDLSRSPPEGAESTPRPATGGARTEPPGTTEKPKAATGRKSRARAAEPTTGVPAGEPAPGAAPAGEPGAGIAGGAGRGSVGFDQLNASFSGRLGELFGEPRSEGPAAYRVTMGDRWLGVTLNRGKGKPYLTMEFGWEGKPGSWEAQTVQPGSIDFARGLRDVARWAKENGVGIYQGQAEPERLAAYKRSLLGMGFTESPDKPRLFLPPEQSTVPRAERGTERGGGGLKRGDRIQVRVGNGVMLDTVASVNEDTGMVRTTNWGTHPIGEVQLVPKLGPGPGPGGLGIGGIPVSGVPVWETLAKGSQAGEAPPHATPERRASVDAQTEELLREAMGRAGAVPPPPPPQQPGAPPAEPPPPPDPAWKARANEVKSWLHNLWDHVRYGWRELGQESFPRTHDANQAVGNKLTYVANVREIARLMTANLHEKLYGEMPYEQADLLANTYQEESQRHLRREMVKLSEELRRNGLIDAADAQMEKAKEVVTLVGAKRSDGTAVLSDEAAYQKSLASPEYQEFMKRHAADLAPLLDRWHRSAQGLDPEAELWSRHQIPGRPWTMMGLREGEKPSSTMVITRPGEIEGGMRPAGMPGGPTGSAKNIAQRRAQSTYERTGAKAAYETDHVKILENMVYDGLSVASKADAIRAHLEAGTAQMGKGGQKVTLPDGSETKEIPYVFRLREDRAPAGAPGENSLYVRKDLHPETEKGFGLSQKVEIPTLSKITRLLNGANVMAAVEAASHTKNQLTMLMKPYMIRSTLEAVKDTINDSPDLKKEMLDLAELGAPSRPAREPGDVFGGKMNPFYWTSRALHWTDSVMRIAAGRAFEKMKEAGLPLDTEANKRDFVNQLGVYNERVMNRAVSLMRETGLGPYAVAATNFWRQGFGALVAYPGVTASSRQADVQMRAQVLMKYATVVGGAAALNYFLWGRPDGDDQTPLGAIKLSRSEDLPRTMSFDIANLTGLTRAARQTGLQAFAEAARGIPGPPERETTLDRATGDMWHAAIHPVVGPAVAFGYTAATGKDTLGRQVAEKPAEKKGTTVGYRLKAAAVQANPMIAAALGASYPGKQIPYEERAAQMAGPYGPKFRYNRGYKRPPVVPSE